MGNASSSHSSPRRRALAASHRQLSGKTPKIILGPLVGDAFVNQVHSPLVRLPDNVLVAIMDHLTPQDVAMLRHVSRDFMRIFHQHPHFQKYHATMEKKWLTTKSSLWAIPDPSIFFPGQSTSEWAKLCGHCVTVRGGDVLGKSLLVGMPTLYCNGCRTNHRTMHFSAWQREGSTDDDRVCLGHEACLEVDPGLLISWRRAVAMSRVGVCRDVVYSYEGEALWCNDKLCTLPPERCVTFSPLADGKMEMSAQRFRHFAFDRRGNAKVTVNAFWDACIELQNQPDSKSSLQGDQVQDVLRAFDPNICSCVDWGELLPLAATNNTVARDFAWQLAALPPNAGGRPIAPGAYVGKQGRCLGQPHSFSSQYAMGSYELHILECPSNPRMLVLKPVFKSVVSSAVDPAWRCNLGNSSLKDMTNEAMRGITWCNDYKCGVAQANYFHQSLMELEWKYGW